MRSTGVADGTGICGQGSALLTIIFHGVACCTCQAGLRTSPREVCPTARCVSIVPLSCSGPGWSTCSCCAGPTEPQAALSFQSRLHHTRALLEVGMALESS